MTRTCPFCESDNYLYIETVTTTSVYEIIRTKGNLITLESNPHTTDKTKYQTKCEGSFKCKECGKIWPMLEGIKVTQQKVGVDPAFSSY
jgi:hypothetical protein